MAGHKIYHRYTINMDNPGKLLLISDLEGCASTFKDSLGNHHSQSQVLCGEEFFTALETFLTSNVANKVAFLGDYFDQGPMVVDSINRIMKLYNDYNDRVIIILGNRDINKLRFIYEMDVEPRGSTSLKWDIWTKLYEELPTTTNLYDRVMLILNKSMGAPAGIPQLDEGLSIEAAEGLKSKKEAKGLSREEAAYVLVRAFSEPAAQRLNGGSLNTGLDKKYLKFFENVRELFKAGKIVSYDKDYKVLLSHAGGAEPFILHNSAYYDNIRTEINPTEPTKTLPYYDKIEMVRRMLQVQPTPDQTVDKFDDNTYNEPLAAISSMWDSNEEPPPDFFLLQGLGLKPDKEKHFNSFIQSCDIVPGCKGPYHTDIIMDPPLEYKDFLRQLQNSDNSKIEFIAHGHVPICVPVPLIYKRLESDIIFVASDTSNGYRPADINKVNQVPLAYITTDRKAGVFSLPGSTDSTYTGTFAPMVGEWTKENVPTFIPDEHIVQYDNTNKLTFPGLNPEREYNYAAAKMVTSKTTGGAKRTTKKARKTRKCCRRKSIKKRISKNPHKLNNV
jgi:hypothetical protein